MLKLGLLFMMGIGLAGSGSVYAQTVPVAPQTIPVQDKADTLFEVLLLDDMVSVLRREGLAYGVTLQKDLFPQGASGWQDQVSDIYDQTRLAQEFKDSLRQEIPLAMLDDLLEFFTSDIGRQATQLELSAREAMLDDALKQAAEDMRDDMVTSHPPRLDQLQRFIEVNDLTEANVSSALNANLAFYQGMNQGGGFPTDLSEQDILRDVWAQELAIRKDTGEWLLTFLGLAYQPMSDADLDAYIAFSETPAGQALNRAQFAAFDALFADVSHRLGVAAAGNLAGQEL